MRELYKDKDTHQYPRLGIGWVSKIRLDGIRIPNKNLIQRRERNKRKRKTKTKTEPDGDSRLRLRPWLLNIQNVQRKKKYRYKNTCYYKGVLITE